MPLSNEDKAVIKNLYLFKEYGLLKKLAEFQRKTAKGKDWALYKKIRETGCTDQRQTETRTWMNW